MSKTVTGVPIADVGIEFPTSTGPVTLTADDLVSMVESQGDPAIVAPRLKLGHTDPRFDLTINLGMDGEPAFGTAQNLRLANNNQTVLCDYVGVPDWLAGVLPSAYPNRSIEGNFDVQTVTGHSWRFVVTDIALLGVVWPGISTLDDLQAALSDKGPEGVSVVAGVIAAVSDTPWSSFSDSDYSDTQYAAATVYDRAKCNDSWKDKPAKQRYSLRVKEPNGTVNRNGVHAAAGRISQVTGGCAEATKAAAVALVNLYKNQLKEDPPESLTKLAAALASTNMEDVRRGFYDQVAAPGTDQFWWWIRAVLVDPNELIVDDDEGGLYRVSFSTDGDGNVSFDDAIPVAIQYVDQPVAASSGQPVFASTFTDSQSSRPAQRQQEGQVTKPATKKISAAVDPKALRRAFNLAEDATDEEVLAAIKAATEASPEVPETPPTEPTQTPATQPIVPAATTPTPTSAENPTPSPTPEAIPAQAAASAAPGLVSIDQATLESLQRDASLGRTAYESSRIAARDSFLAGAVQTGKFPPARLKHWTEAWEKDPEGIKAAIQGMPDGLIPVASRGVSTTSEDPTSVGPAYPPEWLPEVKRRGAASTITQEV